jgi:hypothetical protein
LNMAIQQTSNPSAPDATKIDTKDMADAAASGEPFRPASLGSLVAWLFGPRHKPVANEPEPFDEHINGLA